jgi:hypothetical protein
MTEELMLCQCGDPAHQLILFYDDEPQSPAVYVSVHLSPERNFFKRLWRGLKYIFSKKRSIYGDFDEIILRPEDSYKLEKAVNILNKQLCQNKIPIFINPNALKS